MRKETFIVVSNQHNMSCRSTTYYRSISIKEALEHRTRIYLFSTNKLVVGLVRILIVSDRVRMNIDLHNTYIGLMIIKDD